MSTTKSKKKPIGQPSKRRTPGTPGTTGTTDPAHPDRLRKAVLREIGQRIVTTKILASLPPAAGKSATNESAQFVNGQKANVPTTSDGSAHPQNTPRGHSEQGDPGKSKPSRPKTPGTSKNGKSTQPTSPKLPSLPKGQGSSKAAPASSASEPSPHAKWQKDREAKFFKVGQRLALEDARARQQHGQAREPIATSTKESTGLSPSARKNSKPQKSKPAGSKSMEIRQKPLMKEPSSRTRTAAKEEKPKRLSALAAAAQLLAASKKPMRASDLIEAMAAKNLWKSPNGKTPSATLSAAITREIVAKGKNARFKKVERGQFQAAR